MERLVVVQPKHPFGPNTCVSSPFSILPSSLSEFNGTRLSSPIQVRAHLLCKCTEFTSLSFSLMFWRYIYLWEVTISAPCVAHFYVLLYDESLILIIMRVWVFEDSCIVMVPLVEGSVNCMFTYCFGAVLVCSSMDFSKIEGTLCFCCSHKPPSTWLLNSAHYAGGLLVLHFKCNVDSLHVFLTIMFITCGVQLMPGFRCPVPYSKSGTNDIVC